MSQSFSNPVPVAVCLVPYQGKLILLIDDSTPLAFPLHEEVKKQFFV